MDRHGKAGRAVTRELRSYQPQTSTPAELLHSPKLDFTPIPGFLCPALLSRPLSHSALWMGARPRKATAATC